MASKKVLIVHDDTALVDRLRASLVSSGAGMEVVSAISGPRALGIISTQRPDVIVVDADLMGVDGYTLTEQATIHEASSTVKIPFVSEQQIHFAKEGGAYSVK